MAAIPRWLRLFLLSGLILFILGVLPMANILFVGSLPWLRRSRDGVGGFRVGFLVSGGLAMAVFLALSLSFTDYFFQLPQSWTRPYLVLRPGIGLVSSALLIFLGPQLVLAMFGGLIGRSIMSGAHKYEVQADRLV